MFRAALFAAVLLAAAWPARAQTSLGLEVQVTASGGTAVAMKGLKVEPGGKPLGNGWFTSEQRDYAQHREQESSRGLEVQVRNVGHTVEGATLEWYFFTRALDSAQQEELFDRGSEVVTVNPGATAKYAVHSQAVKRSVTKALHLDNGVDRQGRPISPVAVIVQNGGKVTGWIVRLVADDKILAVKASSPSLAALGNAPDGIETF